MKKKNILGLGLGLLLVTSPINPIEKNYQNLALASELEENQETSKSEGISYEKFKKELEEFKTTEAYTSLDEKSKSEFETLTKDLNKDNIDQESYNEISGKISEYNLSHKASTYKTLYDKVKNMIKDNLSDELKNSFDKFKESYDTVEEYDKAITNLDNLKDRINSYNEQLTSKKATLKDGIEKNKALDLKDEKLVLEDEKSNLEAIENAITSINKKVEEFKNNQKREEREKLSKEIDEVIKKHEKVKKDIVYRKSSKESKGKVEKAFKDLKYSQKALKDGKDGDYRKVLDNYNDLVYKLDGHKFVDNLNKLITYFNDNKDKIKDQKLRAKLAEELNSVESDDSFDSKKLAKLDKKIKDAVKKSDDDSAGLRKVTEVSVDKTSEDKDKTEKNKPKAKARRVQVSKSKNPVKKKSRSFVRTGVGSVGIVVGVLAIAAGGYLYLRKKK